MKQILILTLAFACYQLEDTLVEPEAQPIEEDLFELFDLNDNDVDVKIENVQVGEVQAQDPFFEKHGIDPIAVLEATLYSEPFLEFNNPARHSTHLNQDLKVQSIKADNFCFINFMGENKFEKKFFFECEKKFDRASGEEVFFRELDENCPYPDAIPPMKPMPRECTYYAMATKQTLAGAIDAVGQDHTDMVMRCLLTCIATEVEQITVKCAEEALIGDWAKITGEELQIIQNHEDLDESRVNEDGSQTFVNKRQKVLKTKNEEAAATS